MMTPSPADISTDGPPPAPLRLAIRSLLVLGVACTLFGLTFVIAFGVFNSFVRFRPWFITMGLVLWLVPGISFKCCALGMLRHRLGAATGGLATVAVQAIGAAGLLYASVSFDPVTPLPIILCVMWLVALADLAVTCSVPAGSSRAGRSAYAASSRRSALTGDSGDTR